METANRDDFETVGFSVSNNILLLNKNLILIYISGETLSFFVTIFLVMKYSYAYVVMPDRMGILDEIFEVINQI